MKAFLKGSAEEINFETQDVQHFLVFQRQDGSTFRLPVGEETTQALVAVLTGQMTPEVVPTPLTSMGPLPEMKTFPVETSVDDLDGATEFGGGETSTDESEAPTSPSFEVHDPSESQSEEEVQSL